MRVPRGPAAVSGDETRTSHWLQMLLVNRHEFADRDVMDFSIDEERVTVQE